ncbi:uracil-xanthine permease family protein [Desulfonatronum sp. SC1]|uniref:uracil-xanthine permease family protein n=1 Tax=Desulfonatronum sp. SC1 TaxID=2109626 RepID=UPI000D31F03E|nr:solute carrier family 23 protein [Desulfonatronum sp. SC1]PTN37549.1 xanthine/uracil/vitamin C permease [Desulfonatronum sp. SC1]
MIKTKGKTTEKLRNQTSRPGNILYAVDERPPEWVSAFTGLQLLLLIVGPITVTPLVVARMAGIDPMEYSWIIFASLMASSICTFIQIRRFGSVGSGYLLIIGSSSAFVACALTAAQIGGMALVATMTVLSAPLQILFGWLLGPLRKIITPLVGGVVIMLIVVSVLGITFDLMTGAGKNGTDAHYLMVSVGTLMIILCLAIFGNKFLRLWSLVLGLLAGTILASFFGLTDFSRVADSSWIGLPQGSWPGFYLDFSPELLSLYLTFVLVTIVGAVETLGDGMAIQQISKRDFRKIDYERVQGAIYADGVSNAIAGALGTIPNTTYSIAISAVELTGVTARRVGYYVAGFLGLLAFSPKVAAIITSIPAPVIGVFLFVLLSMLFVTGIKLAASHGLNYESGIIIGVSFWVGFTFHNDFFFPHLIPEFVSPFLSNGMAVGGLTAIILSTLFYLKPAGRAGFTLDRDLSQVSKLHDLINTYSQSRKIPPDQLYRLQLTSEELFTHLCAVEKFKAPGLRVNLHGEGDTIHVEFIDSSQAKDIDFEVEELQGVEGLVDPDELGLLILGRYARNLRHITIGGINYITYDLPPSI